MTLPATLQQNNQFQSQISPAKLVFGAALLGGAGAVAAGLFTTVSPLGGVIFGVSYLLSSRLIHWICDQINCCPESLIFKVGQFALATIGGIAASVLITTIVGFPMTMATGVILAVASIGITAAALLTLGGCLCSSAVVTGMALGTSDGGISIRV
jgi:ABC-type branched-subunit amino acid transport system permease subunit